MTGSHILLVEDSPTQAARTAALLEQEAFVVTHAASAEEALSLLGSSHPDLLIVDYDLPGMRGDDFCRRIRLDPSLATVPVLILTATDELDAERVGLDSGADDYMAKSADPTILAVRIKSLLQRGAQLDRDPSRAAHSAPRSLRCLVVDESSTQRFLVESLLAEEGYEVVAVATPAEALTALGRENFDCVVGDLVMPDMDGIELCRRLDMFRRSSRLSFSILVVSGQDSTDDMMRALDLGADDFVSKSTDVAIIKSRVRALLRRKILRDEHERIRGEFRDKELEVVRERAEKEAALERAQLAAQLEEANRELEAFSYSVAHDLRAPLRSIDGFSQALLEEYADKLDDEGRVYLGYVRESAQHMAQLIDDLLNLSRVTRRELRRESVDLSDLARDVIRQLQTSEAERRVEVAIAPGLVADVDRGLLKAVLQNLLGNAWKFTRKRDGARIEFDATRDEKGTTYFVRDNGAGFDPAYADKLFGVFQRLHSAQEFEGTGVGLATVQRIVHRHGGRIWAESKVDHGATFFFTLGVSAASPV